MIPVTGARKSIKVFGAVNLQRARFIYRLEPVFNAQTYLDFLEQMAISCRRSQTHKIHLIQDNASYHKDKDVWGWFKDNRRWLEVHQLPAYSPEFNATERLWHHIRITGTHNRYFATEGELLTTLTTVFEGMRKNPDQIRGYLYPFL